MAGRNLQSAGRPAAERQRGLRRYRRAAQAAAGPGAQPGGDGEGLRQPTKTSTLRRGHRRARRGGRRATGVEDKVQAENALTGALGQLFAVAEAYPELKANQNFIQLQDELTDIENKLAAARRFFNNAVAEFNAAIQQFPAVLFAAALGFTPRTFFDLGEDRAAAAAAPAGEVLAAGADRPCRPSVCRPTSGTTTSARLFLLAGFPFLLLGIVSSPSTLGMIWARRGCRRPRLRPAATVRLRLAADGRPAPPLAIAVAARLVRHRLFLQPVDHRPGHRRAGRSSASEEPEFYNLLENLCISRGMKTPTPARHRDRRHERLRQRRARGPVLDHRHPRPARAARPRRAGGGAGATS